MTGVEQINKQKDYIVDLSNEFTKKALISQLPQKFTKELWIELKIAAEKTSKNKSIGTSEMFMGLTTLLIKHYGYRNLESSNIFKEGQVEFLFEMYAENRELSELLHKDLELTIRFITHAMKIKTRKMSQGINLIKSFEVLSKVDKKEIKYIISKTKKNYFDLINDSFIKDKEGKKQLYTLENIKNKQFFQDIKEILSEHFYLDDEIELQKYRKSIRDEMKKHYFETIVKRLFLCSAVSQVTEGGQIKCEQESVNTYNELAEVFNLEKYDGRVYKI